VAWWFTNLLLADEINRASVNPRRSDAGTLVDS
jgi:hypothetical protein